MHSMVNSTAVLPEMSKESCAVLGPAQLGISTGQYNEMIAMAENVLDFRVCTNCKCGSNAAAIFIPIQMWECKAAQDRDVDKMSNAGKSIVLTRKMVPMDNGKLNIQLNALKCRTQFDKEDLDKCYHIYQTCPLGDHCDKNELSNGICCHPPTPPRLAAA